ncbi:MAG: HDOD domain-containing protein [Planctomycetes bacterium]|nr:HDOD domain-containing protein [Planctomycetota bacterium]
MSEQMDISGFHQIALSLRGIESLCSLASVAGQLFSKLSSKQFSASDLCGLIKSDAALTSKILSVAYDNGVVVSGEGFSIDEIVGQMDGQAVSDALFSIKVFSGVGPFDAAPFGDTQGRQGRHDGDMVLPKRELAKHNVGVACCSRLIAEQVGGVNVELAYAAGLLHDVGKLGIDKVMPKSFARLVEQAKERGVSLCEVERESLGGDHGVIGKRLAQRWHFPEEIVFAIWLHHSDISVIGGDSAKEKIARIVQLADSIVRLEGIGESGSYDAVELSGEVIKSLGLSDGQVERIQSEVLDCVAEKCLILGLEQRHSRAAYCDVVGAVAGQLAKERALLLEQNRELRTAASHFGFVTEFLSSIDSSDELIDIAEKLALCWQKFYQAGTVCLYLKGQGADGDCRAVVAERGEDVSSVVIAGPGEGGGLAGDIESGDVFELDSSMSWLLEQCGIEMDFGTTKVVPLWCGQREIGGILFELSYPADMEALGGSIKAEAKSAAGILAIAMASGRHQEFAERFAQLKGKGKVAVAELVLEEEAVEGKDEKAALFDAAPFGDTQGRQGRQGRAAVEEVVESKEEKEVGFDAAQGRQGRQDGGGDLLEALAEMAAGAAHELNNPLSVISGRAQILARGEEDDGKRKILQQIQANAAELAGIIDGLMSFAEPASPKREVTGLSQIIDEASQLAAMKSKVEKVEIVSEISEGGSAVYVDSGQVVSALANIFVNSLESYPAKSGAIELRSDRKGEMVEVSITDFGKGMDSETLSKALHPFFSGKTAGRQRGMGLAYANRLIGINGGRIEISSTVGEGTTVRVYLPG